MSRRNSKTPGIDGYHDNRQDNNGEVVLHKGQIAKEVTAEGEQSHPQNCPDDIEEEEAGILHGADPGYEGSKGADDGDEAGQDDRLATMLFIKIMGAIDVLFFKKRTFPLNARGPI